MYVCKSIKSKNGVKDTIPFFSLILLPFHLLVYGCVCVCVFIRSDLIQGKVQNCVELQHFSQYVATVGNIPSGTMHKLTWSFVLVFRAGTSAFLCLDHLLITDTVKQALLSFSVYFVVHPCFSHSEYFHYENIQNPLASK